MEYIRRILREYITSDEHDKLMGEGLIKTTNSDKVVSMLNHFGKGKLKAKVYTDAKPALGFILVEPNIKTEEYFNKIIQYMNNMGYFIASYFDYDDISYKEYDKSKNIQYLRFEPKFDIEYVPKQRYLYHVTDGRHLDKILKIGLTPKTKSKLSYHPDRIYLALSIDKAKKIQELFSINEFNPLENSKILEIDMVNLLAFFRYDAQFDGGIYTTDNIPPDHIKLL